MAKTSSRQRKTTGRVMHEFKHGELESGPAGKGGKVKSRRQAIAIALNEAGASKYQSRAANRKNQAKTQSKEARGKTAQQEREGKSHVGASGRRESSGGAMRAPRKTTAVKTTARKTTAPKSGARKTTASTGRKSPARKASAARKTVGRTSSRAAPKSRK